MSALFPIFMKLGGRPCLVVGAGTVGEPKIASLLDADATVKVVAPEATEQVKSWARESRIHWEQRAFEASDIERCFLVVTATNSIEVNETVYREAQARGVLCNAVDDPDRCDFYYPAIVRRGPLQIAVSTAGYSPALAQRLRRELEDQFGPEYSGWVEQLGQERTRLRDDRTISAEDCRERLHVQASASAYQEFIADRHLTPRLKDAQNGG
ncbi:MAG: bifunctional precorrin-2 dehydrogenase/sirohydrochlorin ferrochelatase [Bryobacteraceae bacterium]